MSAMEAPIGPGAEERRRRPAGAPGAVRDLEGACDAGQVGRSCAHQRRRGARRHGRPGRPARADGPRSTPSVRRSGRRTEARTSASVWLSRLAVGSSSRRSGASRTNARARASALAFARGQPGATLAQRRVEPVGEAPHDLGQSGRRRAQPRTSASEASGRPSRTFSATERAKRWGRWGTQPMLAPPVLEVEVGQVDAAERRRSRRPGARRPRRPRARSTCRTRSARRGPRSRPGRRRRSNVMERGDPPAGIGDLQAGRAGWRCPGRQRLRPSARGPGSSSSVEDLLGRMHSVGAGVVVGAERPERQVGLGSEDEHEERVVEREVPPSRRRPTRDGDQRHRDGGQELEDERGQEGEAERRHGGGAVAIGHVRDGAGLCLGPPEDLERGQPGHHVEEVPGQLVERPHAGRGAALRRGAHQGHEERDQRKADRDRARR